MNYQNEYLSDQELERLIREVEQYELVMAPPDLEEHVRSWIDAPDKKKELRRYCARVMTSVAAAIAVVFLLPEIVKYQPFDMAVPQRKELIQEYSDSLLQMFGGSRIFNDNDEFRIFK